MRPSLLLASLACAVAVALALTGQRPGRVRLWSLAVLVIGVALLGLGITRDGGYRVCCATPTTAQQAEQRVR